MADPMEDAKPKKKPALELVIGMGKDKPGASDGDDATTEEDESSEDYTAAAGEVFDALKTEDREGFIQALKAAVMTCK